MRVVVDTNVLISGILWLGIPHRIIELAEEKRITLCMTQPMLDELGEVLQRRKFARYLHTRRTSVEEILSALIPLVELYSTTEIIIDHIADPDDTMFLVCTAIASNFWGIFKQIFSTNYPNVVTALGFANAKTT